MSDDRDFKPAEWELGMELPSRKVTHGTKKSKKKGRSVDDKAAAEAAEKALREQALREQALREQALREQALREQALREQALREQALREQALREQALREQALREQALREQALREQALREQAQREQALREQALREQAEREQAEREQAEREQALREQAQREQAEREQALREQALREQAEREQSLLQRAEGEQALREEAARELSARAALADPDQAAPLREAAAAFDETAATIILPAVTERMMRPEPVADAAPAPAAMPPAPVDVDVEPATAPATAVAVLTPSVDDIPIPADEPAQAHDTGELRDDNNADAEEENRPFFSKWQWYLLMILTPLFIVLVLAYGKLGYVHQVPDSVRQQVPAYANGEAFLVVKPWWFGPPIFALDAYKVEPGSARETEVDRFGRYKVELGNYQGIVEDPKVVWSFQTDPLK